jgi:exonuclease SbcC
MALLDSINHPKWQDKDPEVRRNSVSQLDDQDVLLELVTGDDDSRVREIALSRISEPGTLDTLIETLAGALQQQARNQRLAQFLPDPDQLSAIDDDVVLLKIAGLTNDPEQLNAALALLKNDDLRLDVASNHPLAKVRLAAAKGIQDIESLDKLIHLVRGHDKAVYRHCKTLLDEHHCVQRADTERKENIQQLLQKAKDLAKAVDSPEYKGRYQSLVQQWQKVEDWAESEQKKRFRRDLTICSDRLSQLSEIQAADKQKQAELAKARQEFQQLIMELEQMDAASSVPDDLAAVKQQAAVLDEIEIRWHAATEITPSSPDQSRTSQKYLKSWRLLLSSVQNLVNGKPRLEKILHESRTVDSSDYQSMQKQVKSVKKLLATLPWPDSHKTSIPSQITRLQEALSKLDVQISTLDGGQEKLIGYVQSALDQLHKELDQDHSKDADRVLARVRKHFKSLAPKQRQRFEQEIRPLAARLDVVHDWQGFAIEPKKMALCSSMRALVGIEENAETLAAKIKSLQDQWKQLGPLPRARDQALWHEFKTAADEAYEPCKAAFELQADLRRENFKNRMQLVAQLKDYEANMDWPDVVNAIDGDEKSTDTNSGSTPDWRLVQKTLDTAREAFRNIKPVDQKGERKSQKAFRKVCDRIYAHIKEEYGRNIARKENLVARAQELSTQEDLQQAIDMAKKIQREWKEIGMTPVGIDRKLWKKFRAACDAVFARLDEQRDQHNAEINACVKQAEALRDQARALLESGDDRRLHLQKDLSDLKQQFREIELPRGVQQRLGKDFQNIESRARDVVKDIRAGQLKAQWQFLIEKINACALKSTDKKKATSLWEKEGALPKGIDNQALESFWDEGPTGGDEDQLREACIALEIFAEIESPTEDKKARMNYQIKRLVEGMGSHQAQAENALQDSINDFIDLHPSSGWVDRFCSVVEKTRD